MGEAWGIHNRRRPLQRRVISPPHKHIKQVHIGSLGNDHISLSYTRNICPHFIAMRVYIIPFPYESVHFKAKIHACEIIITFKSRFTLLLFLSTYQYVTHVVFYSGEPYRVT